MDTGTTVEKDVRSLYNRGYSQRYRISDNQEAQNSFHQQCVAFLQEKIKSFPQRPRVLDVGCGTGRFFYAVRGAKSLTGVDVSPDMLECARSPLHQDLLRHTPIHLMEGNIFQPSLDGEKYDFLYAIGVFGEHSPFDQQLLRRIRELLVPGGQAMITVVDKKTKWKRWVGEWLYPLLPQKIKKQLFFRRKSFYLTRSTLKKLLEKSVFRSHYEIGYIRANSRKWRGGHFICYLSNPV